MAFIATSAVGVSSASAGTMPIDSSNSGSDGGIDPEPAQRPGGGSGVQNKENNKINNVVDMGKNQSTVGAIATQVNDATGMGLMAYSPETGIFSFDNQLYSKMGVQEKRDYMSNALGYIKESSLNTKNKNKLFNFVADQDSTTTAAIRNLKTDSQADLATASAWYKPFSGPVSIILGLFAILIFVFLGLGVVWDISYMTMPFFRMLLVSSQKDGKEGRPWGVSQEAYVSMMESENASAGGGHFKGYMGPYIKRRAIVMILIGIAIMYMITGQIFDLIGFFVDAFSPITDQLK